MLKHTPGPWVIMHEINGNIMVGDGAYGFITCDKICDGKDGRGSVLDNAKLIAAAPVLLEALESLVESNSIGLYPDLSHWLKAKEAIKKARG